MRHRKFISDFAGITRPLNDLLKKGVNVAKAWTTEHSDAVARIKNAMITYPVLRQYDPKRELHLVTDASDLAVGACLYQFDSGSPYAIAYTSRSLNAAELNYTVQEKEC